MPMTDRQRKYALKTIDGIYARKLEELKASEQVEIKAVPSIASVYAAKLAMDRGEQRALVEAMLDKINNMANGEDFSTNPSVSMQFSKSSDGRISPPRLTEIRIQHFTRVDDIRAKYSGKRVALDARVEKLRRDIMLGDLPPASLALINEFDSETT